MSISWTLVTQVTSAQLFMHKNAWHLLKIYIFFNLKILCFYFMKKNKFYYKLNFGNIYQYWGGGWQFKPQGGTMPGRGGLIFQGGVGTPLHTMQRRAASDAQALRAAPWGPWWKKKPILYWMFALMGDPRSEQTTWVKLSNLLLTWMHRGLSPRRL